MLSPEELVVPEQYTLPHMAAELASKAADDSGAVHARMAEFMLTRAHAIEVEGFAENRLNAAFVPPGALVTFSLAIDNGGKGHERRAGRQDITVVRTLTHFVQLRTITQLQEPGDPEGAAYGELDIANHDKPVFIAGTVSGKSNLRPQYNRRLVPHVRHLGGLFLGDVPAIYAHGEHVPDHALAGGSASKVIGAQLRYNDQHAVIFGNPTEFKTGK